MVTTWKYFVFTYAVIFPIGIGFCFYTVIMTAWEHFPEKKGLVSGIIIAGFGFGATLTGKLTLMVVNPDNVRPINDNNSIQPLIFPNEVAEKVPQMLRICSYFFAVLSTIGVLLISRDPIVEA